MPIKIEDKFTNLIIEIQSTAKIFLDKGKKSTKKSQLIATIQIILVTSTTILLGLKLGQIGQSIAFILSAIATGLSTWYNIEANRKKQVNIFNFGLKLLNLSTEVLFYKMNFDPLEEEKFIKYTEAYYSIRKEFGEETAILLNSNSVKKDSKIE